ncbi:MAG: MarR family winged helix-turn-helix transcriptional regulator [Alphaproteobacteria bacterium]
MSRPRKNHSPEGAAATSLVLELFRLNGALLAAGDQLLGGLGLTSARWQVMGAIALADAALPVAHIARNMGLTRQAVQRVADDLADAGIVGYARNPHHRRAKLVLLTARGRALYAEADARQAPWINRLAAGIAARRLTETAETVRLLRERLEAAKPPAQPKRGT